MAQPHVISLGCRLNAFEAEFIREHSKERGNTVIINTCAVTAEAERQARQTIRRVRRKNPNTRLIVTGCAAQLNPAAYGAMPEVDCVMGNREKLSLMASSPYSESNPIIVSDIMKATETAAHLIHGFENRARAFVEIQQGCDHRCTFCIIPFTRGPNRSVGVGRIVNQVRVLVDQGFKEVVLTGVDVCSYGVGLPGEPNLGSLVRRLLKAVPELARLRLSSLDPAAIDEGLFSVLAEEPRLMPHLHLSLQALDDKILKRMKRRHLHADVENVICRAQTARPDVVFGADLIAGFPTETEKQFENTLSAVEALGLSHLHVFPYSERTDTPAARMPTVPVKERKIRAEILREAGKAAMDKFMASQIGNNANVLVEQKRQGLSEHYVPVKVTGKVEPGEIQSVRLNRFRDGILIGEPCS